MKKRQKKYLESLRIVLITVILNSALMLIGSIGVLNAQTTTQVTLEGTLHIYLVTNYGDEIREVDRYYRTGESSMIAFVLKTAKPVDVAPYLSQEEIEILSGKKSEFMVVPDYDNFDNFSYKAFASQFAHKRVRITGTLVVPMGGWRNVTTVRMDFSKVELVE